MCYELRSNFDIEIHTYVCRCTRISRQSISNKQNSLHSHQTPNDYCKKVNTHRRFNNLVLKMISRQHLKAYHRPKACWHCIVHETRKCDCSEPGDTDLLSTVHERQKILKTNLPRVYREVGCQWRWISSGAISSRCSSNGAIVNCTGAAGIMIPLHFSKLPSAYCSQHRTTTSS